MKTRTLLVLVLLSACEEKKAPPPAPKPAPTVAKTQKIDPNMLAVFAPLPEKDEKTTPETAELGKMLFFETRLSKNKDLSCNSCHALDNSGADGKQFSEGHKRESLTRNTPTVFAASVQFKQFWDGRAADVEEASAMSITDPKQMAMDEKSVVAALSAAPEYTAAFKRAFPGAPISLANVAKALGAFQRTLLFPTKWDKYLTGSASALNDEELKGLKAFLDVGCQTCHQGPGVGGTMFQKLGLVKPWPNQRDLGRYEVSKQEADKMMFKVPSLRQIGKTGPYLHDGSESTMEKVVKDMADLQLGRQLTDEQTASIATFLKTLDGEAPADVTRPPSSKKTAANP